MLLILLCFLTTSEADIAGVAVEDDPYHQYSIIICFHVTDATEGQSDRTVSEVEMHMKQRDGIPHSKSK